MLTSDVLLSLYLFKELLVIKMCFTDAGVTLFGIHLHTLSFQTETPHGVEQGVCGVRSEE